jgi:hypothetical protein
VPIFAVPTPRYALGLPVANDEIEYTVSQGLMVGVEATATLTLRALSSGDKWDKLAPVTVSITVPRANYGTASFDPAGFPGVTQETNTGVRSKVWSITQIAQGQTLTFIVPFVPQQAGTIMVAFTAKAAQLNRVLQLTVIREVSESTGA